MQPAYPEAHFNLGNALAALGRRDEALAAYREAVRLRPDYAEALGNLGLALTEARRPGEAAVLLRQAARLRPGLAEAHNNLGLALTALGRFAEAEAAFEQALRLRPGEAATRWNLSLALLQAGDYGRDWAEYEARWLRPGCGPRPFAAPPWDGAPLEGRTVLLWCEQGLGDAIQFVRYAPLVRNRGGRVALECPGPLAALLRGAAGVDAVVAEGGPRPPFDVQAPLLSLPRLLGTTLTTVPAAVPYLAPDAALVGEWRRRLEGLPGFRVGVCWQGNPYHPWDHHRSVPLGHFAPLAGVPGVRLVALQKEFGREQAATLGGRFAVADFGEELGRPPACFLDTASLVACLDLVVTADTAVAHLAGALGRPVWVVLPASFVDWRWLRDRDDSPWYPTTRLFRQEKLGDWGPVFARVAGALRRAARPPS